MNTKLSRSRLRRSKLATSLALLFATVTALLGSPSPPAAAALTTVWVDSNQPTRLAGHRCQEFARNYAVRFVQCTDLAYQGSGPNRYEMWGYTQVVCIALVSGAAVTCDSVDVSTGVTFRATAGPPYVDPPIRHICGGGWTACPRGRYTVGGPHRISSQCLEVWGATSRATVSWGGFRATAPGWGSTHYRLCPYPIA